MRSSPARSPPASRCSRTAATTVSQAGRRGTVAQPLEHDLRALPDRERGRGGPQLGVHGRARAARPRRLGERAPDRVTAGEGVGQAAGDVRRARGERPPPAPAAGGDHPAEQPGPARRQREADPRAESSSQPAARSVSAERPRPGAAARRRSGVRPTVPAARRGAASARGAGQRRLLLRERGELPGGADRARARGEGEAATAVLIAARPRRRRGRASRRRSRSRRRPRARRPAAPASAARPSRTA